MNSRLHNAPVAPDIAGRQIGLIYRDTVAMLRAGGVPGPELDARLLVCHVCGLAHERFAAMPERVVSEAEKKAIRHAVKRRCAREPVSRIMGFREFWGLEFEISPQTLDPRPDTETLVQAGLELAADAGGQEPLSVLDLGTGSGCILVSLLNELASATGLGTDVSLEALAVARANAARHGVASRARFICASWDAGVNEQFDLLVANPPYIPSADIPALEPEVARFDPVIALDGGSDGLAAYRRIVPALHDLLKPGGWALFEVGAGQSEAVSALLLDRDRELSFKRLRQWHDLAGRVRCVAGQRSPTSKKEGKKGLGNYVRSR